MAVSSKCLTAAPSFILFQEFQELTALKEAACVQNMRVLSQEEDWAGIKMGTWHTWKCTECRKK